MSYFQHLTQAGGHVIRASHSRLVHRPTLDQIDPFSSFMPVSVVGSELAWQMSPPGGDHGFVTANRLNLRSGVTIEDGSVLAPAEAFNGTSWLSDWSSETFELPPYPPAILRTYTPDGTPDSLDGQPPSRRWPEPDGRILQR